MYCHHCQWEFSVPEESIGTVVECPHCAAHITVENRTMVLPCPECKTSLRVDLWMIGELAECPTCRKEIKLHCVSAPPETKIGFKEYYKPIPGASCQQGEILGKYQICRCLGVGGMGEVYLARHTVMETFCALKLLKPEVAARNRVLPERLIREAKIAAQLQHPNIITVFDACIDRENNRSYIVMEYVDGMTVEEMLKKGPIPEEQVLEIAKSVTSALVAASRIGLVHRDIKPANIMITKQGMIKLADLGIAKGDADTVGVTLTQDNAVLGTPNYASPEQLRSSHNVDARADVYSLGATMYHMLTGVMPFAGDTVFNVMAKVLEESLPPLESCGKNISPMTRDLVERMLSKNPDDRPPNAAELLSELRAIDPNNITVSGKIKKLRKSSKGKKKEKTEVPAGGLRKKIKLLWNCTLAILLLVLLAFAVRIFANFYQEQETEKAEQLQIPSGVLYGVVEQNNFEKLTGFAEKYRGASREKVYYLLGREVIRQQNIPLLKQLLKQKLISPTGESGQKFLLSALLLNGNTEILQLFLENGMSVNYRDSAGQTLLMKFAGNHKFVKVLLERKDCDVQMRDPRGKTALFYALNNSYSIQYLIDAGGDINAVDNQGHNVLFEFFGKSVENVKFLKQAGINLEHKNNEQQTALEAACFRYHSADYAKALIEAGAKVTPEIRNFVMQKRNFYGWQSVAALIRQQEIAAGIKVEDSSSAQASKKPQTIQVVQLPSRKSTGNDTAALDELGNLAEKNKQVPGVSKAKVRSLNERLSHAEEQLSLMPGKLRQANEVKDRKSRERRIEFLQQRQQFLRKQIRELQSLIRERKQSESQPRPVYDQAAGEEFKRRILQYTTAKKGYGYSGADIKFVNELATFFQSNNIDPDIEVVDGTYPRNSGSLMKFIASGRLPRAETLIQAWIEKKPAKLNHGFPLHLSEALQMKLLELPFDDIDSCSYSAPSLLFFRVIWPSSGSRRVINRLLQLGANPDFQNRAGRTVLHLAAGKDTVMVRELLSAGADPDIADKEGRTPVFYAVMSGNFAAIQPLLAAGADADVVDKYGKKALDYKLQGQLSLAVKNDKLAAIRDLTRRGANVNLSLVDNLTPLQYACQKNKMNMITVLLEVGADINRLGGFENFRTDVTPLQIAYQNLPNSLALFQKLIRNGANTAVPPIGHGGTTLLDRIFTKWYYTSVVRLSETQRQTVIYALISKFSQLTAEQQQQCFVSALTPENEKYLPRLWTVHSGWSLTERELTAAVRNKCSATAIKWLLEQGARPAQNILDMTQDHEIKRLLQQHLTR